MDHASSPYRALFRNIVFPTVHAEQKPVEKKDDKPAPKPHNILPWKRWVAGAIAGTADVWACHPFDRIKTHLQNNPSSSIAGSTRAIWDKGGGSFNGGMRSFYEGILPMTAEAIFKVGIRYFAFQLFVEQYNSSVHGDAKKPATFGLNLVGGAFAGTIESFLVVIPCELLKVRHMTQEHHVSFSQVFKNVIKEEGFLGLYKGASATLLRQITNHMIRFPVFFSLTSWMKGENKHAHLAPWQNLLAGGLAGTASTLFNNPFDTIKTRMQKQGQNLSAMEVVKGIYQERGLRGYWAGVSTRIMRVAPGQAITWAVLESVLNIIGRD
jgi:solute carrier family 25 citrate transporter 1